jgi:hypothetical protein
MAGFEGKRKVTNVTTSKFLTYNQRARQDSDLQPMGSKPITLSN